MDRKRNGGKRLEKKEKVSLLDRLRKTGEQGEPQPKGREKEAIGQDILEELEELEMEIGWDPKPLPKPQPRVTERPKPKKEPEPEPRPAEKPKRVPPPEEERTPSPETEQVPPAKEEQAAPPEAEQAPRPKEEQVPPAKEEQTPPPEKEQVSPAKEEQAPPPETEQVPPTKKEQTPPPKEEPAGEAGEGQEEKPKEFRAQMGARLQALGIKLQAMGAGLQSTKEKKRKEKPLKKKKETGEELPEEKKETGEKPPEEKKTGEKPPRGKRRRGAKEKREGGQRQAKAPERQYNPWLWLSALFLGPLAILLCVQVITFASLPKALVWVGSHLGATLLCYLALLWIMMIVTCLLWKIWACFLILAIPCVVLAVVNRMKMSINGTPLLLSDFTMATEAGAVMDFMSPEFRIGLGVWIGLAVAVVGIVMASRIGWRPKELTPRWSLRKTVIKIVAALLAVTLLLPFGFYLGPEGESQAERNQRLGLIGGMYSAILNSVARRSEGYSKDELDDLLNKVGESGQPAEATPTPAPTATPEPVTPNVVLMMSESFCDPKRILPGVSFSGDPIPNYRRLAAQWPSGDFLSNTYAGGTGSVEMEVLTGLPVGFMHEGDDLTNLKGDGVYDRLPSIVKAFSASGYATEFVHNYTTRLYNRTRNLPAIGFEKLTFEDGFPADAERDGPYITDRELTKQMIRAFEDRDKSKPLFLYGLTMQNHQPYYKDKFPNPSGLDPQSDKLPEGAMGSVEALVYGVHGADQALGDLIDYFEDCGEPVMVVFWGDHLPGLYVDDDNTVYSLLDYVPTVDTLEWDAEIMRKMHSTPFLVWNNYEADLDVPDTVSVNSLGTQIMDWAGVEKPLYYHWVDTVQKDMLLYRSRLYVSADGTAYKEPPEEDRELVESYRGLVQDIVYGDGEAAAQMTAMERKAPAATAPPEDTKKPKE